MDESIMDINVNNLKNKQYEFLKNNTKCILNNILTYLEANNLQLIQNTLCYSPAGDGYGCDNYFINFSYKSGEIMDLQDILELMADLKGIELKEEEY